MLGSFFRKLGAKLGQVITKSIEGVGSDLCMAVGSPGWLAGMPWWPPWCSSICVILVGDERMPGVYRNIFWLEIMEKDSGRGFNVNFD